MNKLRLLTFLLLAAFFIQSCKKDTIVGTAYTTAPFQANIDGSTWAPDTVVNTITFNAASKTKTFYLSGTKEQKQVIMSVALSNSQDTPGFMLGTYSVDNTSVFMHYNTQQNVSGNYVYLPHGTVRPGDGTINITAIDSVKKQITGTFNLYSRTTNTDGSITIDNIFAGVFNSLPYTYTSN